MVFDILKNPAVIVIIGLVTGCVWNICQTELQQHDMSISSIKIKRFRQRMIERPFSTVCEIILSGMITAIGANVISAILPNGLVPIVPLAMMTSAGFLIITSFI